MEIHRRLESTERALREREVTFAALAKVAPVGIMRFDPEGRCNYVNDRWSDFTGLTIDRAIGDGWHSVLHPEDRPHVLERWNGMRLQEEIFQEEYRILRADGRIRWALAEGVPLRSYGGRLLGFIRAVTDITRHREMELQLKAIRAELEERVQERTAALELEMRERQNLEKQVLEIKENEQRRFSEDLHDGLGQHLTGILFRASALQRDLETAEASYAADAAKIAELVNDTINQAHDLARGIYPVPLREDGLVLALHELQQKLCAPSMAECTFECNEPVDVHDPAIATHVYRIAQEAVTNAVKHSRAARVTIVLIKCENGAELTMCDDGIGFDRKEISPDGNGLGIMKHRARLIDAGLTIHSAPGQGTKITCRFPLHPPPQCEQA